jgi:hypothetical protein
VLFIKSVKCNIYILFSSDDKVHKLDRTAIATAVTIIIILRCNIAICIVYKQFIVHNLQYLSCTEMYEKFEKGKSKFTDCSCTEDIH